jgi:hypothetical protein
MLNLYCPAEAKPDFLPLIFSSIGQDFLALPGQIRQIGFQYNFTTAVTT